VSRNFDFGSIARFVITVLETDALPGKIRYTTGILSMSIFSISWIFLHYCILV